MFLVPAFYVLMVLFIIKFFVAVIGFMNENIDKGVISINCIVIDDYIRLFAEFVISTFSTLVSIYIYGSLENMLGKTYFFIEYSSVIQMASIIMAILIRNLVTKLIKFRDKELENYIRTSDEIASLRLLGSIFAILHLVYFNCCLDETAYEELLICYILLVIGRFLFYDSSLLGLWREIRRMIKYVWIVVIMIILFYLPIYFFLKDNGVTSLNDGLLGICIIYASILFGIHFYIDTFNPMFNDIHNVENW